jgi:hypothetical protein
MFNRLAWGGVSGQSVLPAWGNHVDGVGIACWKVAEFYTAVFKRFGAMGKSARFYTLFTNVLPAQFHNQKLDFISVLNRVLPIIHTPNNNNNKINKNYSYYLGG